MEAPKPRKVIVARNLRREQTPFEPQLWKILRAGRLNGFHFRRRYPIGPYIADFTCIKAQLVIELDDNSHDERLEHDARRDAAMSSMG
jgi:very-short-patch-repair endonuclease